MVLQRRKQERSEVYKELDRKNIYYQPPNAPHHAHAKRGRPKTTHERTILVDLNTRPRAKRVAWMRLLAAEKHDLGMPPP
jgi:hypothetical protein